MQRICLDTQRSVIASSEKTGTCPPRQLVDKDKRTRDAPTSQTTECAQSTKFLSFFFKTADSAKQPIDAEIRRWLVAGWRSPILLTPVPLSTIRFEQNSSGLSTVTKQTCHSRRLEIYSECRPRQNSSMTVQQRRIKIASHVAGRGGRRQAARGEMTTNKRHREKAQEAAASFGGSPIFFFFVQADGRVRAHKARTNAGCDCDATLDIS